MANNAITKGDVLAAARVAGIQAAKRTADLVPMCHPLLVGSVHVDFTIGDDYVEVEAKVETVDRTGVEMEAMTACAIAALTVYDMCKTADRTMSIGQLMLWEKTGGRSGPWRRSDHGGVGAAAQCFRARPARAKKSGVIIGSSLWAGCAGPETDGTGGGIVPAACAKPTGGGGTSPSGVSSTRCPKTKGFAGELKP